jgi:hypothetical protein
MIGQHLTEFDRRLCGYAIDNFAQYLDRPRFAARVDKLLTKSQPLLLASLKKAADKSPKAVYVRLLLNDIEFRSLQNAVEDDLDLFWEPFSGLHRRYIETVKEVRDNFTRQVAEDWSAECAGFARQLEAERGVRLSDGLEIVHLWVRRLRALLRAMGAVHLLPQPEGRFATPTNPEPLTGPEAVSPPGDATVPGSPQGQLGLSSTHPDLAATLGRWKPSSKTEPPPEKILVQNGTTSSRLP